MAVVIAHGAGSSGTAACDLLGIPAGDGVVTIEDRTGDIDQVIAGIDSAVRDVGPHAQVVGVSLGAHATARWAAALSTRGRLRVSGIACVLPAWLGPPGCNAAALATAQAGAHIARLGIEGVLEELRVDPVSSDVLRLLDLSWAGYSDETLATCLLAASHGSGPDPRELAAIDAPVAIVGWEHDALHSAAMAREWSRHLRRPRLAMAARPEARLLRHALATAIACEPLSRS